MTEHEWEMEPNPSGNAMMDKWICRRCGFWYRTKGGKPPRRPLGLLHTRDTDIPDKDWYIPVDCDLAIVRKIMYDEMNQIL